MAHPDPKRNGAEDGQREHAGQTREYTDAGLKTHSQGATGSGPTPIEDPKDRPKASDLHGGDTRTNDLEPPQGLVSPVERSDRDGPLRGDLDRESGAGAAGGRDASGGSARGAGAFGRGNGNAGGGPRTTGGHPNEPSGR
ncbi:hypothetical protein [Caldimonas tepidiphila]|uniref:hypothetical protein n=1 Tax=Caldimonas tepidiphila TaxID=2315841 RepID=UPI0014739B3D|nr:hypothetical protein [Caldimonas tepidiphila]